MIKGLECSNPIQKHFFTQRLQKRRGLTVVSSLAGNVIVNVKDARVAISEQMASRIMV